MIRALQITKPGEAGIIELPMPVPKKDEALIQVEAIATCPHWDRYIFEGRPMFEGMEMKYPYWPGQPGHECIGRVVLAGEDVPSSLLEKRVAVWRASGPYQPGLYATHGVVPAENLLEIPEDLPAEKITSLELAMCVQVSVDQLEEVHAIRNNQIAVAGMGPAGLIAIQLLRNASAGSILAIDPLEERRSLALELGADQAIEPGNAILGKKREAGGSFDAALDTTGLKASIEALMKSTRRAVAIFGVLRENVVFGPEQWYGGFSLIGYGAHNRKAGEKALSAILNGALDLAPLISEKRPLSAYAEGVASLQSMKAIKVLFDPTC